MHASQHKISFPSCSSRQGTGARVQSVWSYRLQQTRKLHCSRQSRGIFCAAGAEMTFQFGNTTLSFPFELENAQKLSSSIGGLLQTFQAKQKAERPKRWESMEYQFKGDATQAVELLEVFCNPNAYTTPFDARVMISLKTGSGVTFRAEESLTSVKSAVDAFLT